MSWNVTVCLFFGGAEESQHLLLFFFMFLLDAFHLFLAPLAQHNIGTSLMVAFGLSENTEQIETETVNVYRVRERGRDTGIQSSLSLSVTRWRIIQDTVTIGYMPYDYTMISYIIRTI